MIEFAQKELNVGLIEANRRAEFSREFGKNVPDLVFTAWAIPEESGGVGADILTAMLTMEGLGYGCRDNGLVFAINAQMWRMLQHLDSPSAQSRRSKNICPACAAARFLGAHGMTEPDSGSGCLQPTHPGRAPRRRLRPQRNQDISDQCSPG